MGMFCFTTPLNKEIWVNADHVMTVTDDIESKGHARIGLSNGGSLLVAEKVDMVIMSLSAVENAENS